MTNNILSYFIKDINDPEELANYKIKETKYNCLIKYKEKELWHSYKNQRFYNLITGINKYDNSGESRISKYYETPYKYHYYLDFKINCGENKDIMFTYNTSLNKIKKFLYNEGLMHVCKIFYNNMHKYLKKHWGNKIHFMFKYNKIICFISGKYELDYYSKLYLLYIN